MLLRVINKCFAHAGWSPRMRCRLPQAVTIYVRRSLPRWEDRRDKIKLTSQLGWYIGSHSTWDSYS